MGVAGAEADVAFDGVDDAALVVGGRVVGSGGGVVLAGEAGGGVCGHYGGRVVFDLFERIECFDVCEEELAMSAKEELGKVRCERLSSWAEQRMMNDVGAR